MTLAVIEKMMLIHIYLFFMFMAPILASHDTVSGLSFKVSSRDGSGLTGPVILTCEHSDHSPTSLSMFMKYSDQSLETQVQENSIVYRIESLQCRDMGRYFCQHKNNTKEAASVDVVMTTCAPQLCPGERVKDIYYNLESEITLTFCVISHQPVSVKVSPDNVNKSVPAYTVSSSALTVKDIYKNVDITMSNLTRDKSGVYTIQLCNVQSATQYTLSLQESTESLLTFVDTGSFFHVSLLCTSSVYPASSLGIFFKTSEELLHNEVHGNSTIYISDKVQCEDMGTYKCRHAGNPSQWTSADVLFLFCAPQLCHGEDKDRVIFAELNANITFSFCVITLEEYFRMFISKEIDGMTKTLPEHRFMYSIVTSNGQHLYHTVNITMYNIQREDYGTVIFNLQSSENGRLIFGYKTQFKEKAPLRLCPDENQHRTISANLSENIAFSLCVIGRARLSVQRVVLSDGKNSSSSEDIKYNYFIMKPSGQDPHHMFMVEMYNIQESDFGTITFRVTDTDVHSRNKLDYKIRLLGKAHHNTPVTDGPTDESTQLPLSGHPPVQTTDSVAVIQSTQSGDSIPGRSSGEISTGSFTAIIVVTVILAVVVMGGVIVNVLVIRKRGHCDVGRTSSRSRPVAESDYITPFTPVYQEVMHMRHLKNVDPTSEVTETLRDSRVARYSNIPMTASEEVHLYEEVN